MFDLPTAPDTNCASRRRQGSKRKSTSPRFEIEFVDEQAVKRIGWLFSMVLGYSRLALGQLRFNAGLPDAAIVFLDAYRRGWT